MNGDRRDLTEGFLFTDQYQLTMAQLYWKYGLHERTAQFDYFFRRYPDYGEHQAGYAVFAGLGWLLDWMDATRVRDEDLEYLRSQRCESGQRRFDEGFLSWLSGAGNFQGISIRSVPEGRVAHRHEPLSIIEGPLAIGQILETPLLNHLNYQTLIATKASRVAESAAGGPVFEFGMRRGPDTGANAGARAALIGGAGASSNVGASHAMGVDPKGTHAHSMVQLFMALGEGEIGAFRAYAETYPDECLLLVDTIDTLESGVPNAITVFEELRAKGHEPVGIRLDSGDLAHLAVRAARMLNDAGFPDTRIVLSSELDELAMWQIRAQIVEEASLYGVDAGDMFHRLTYGVGTRLITSHGYPALGGVCKLVAVDGPGEWMPAMKISDTPEKMPIPGDKRVWRVYDERGLATADVVSTGDEILSPGDGLDLFHPHRQGVMRHLEAVGDAEELVLAAYREGERIGEQPSLDEMRQRRIDDLHRLDPGVRRLVNPHVYHVSLSAKVKGLQRGLIEQARSGQ
ncbi:MAG: nicotinate phosphoribosyltransferase [Actinomycetota bacterium]